MTPTKEMIAMARKCAVLVADPTEGSIASGILAGEYDGWPLVAVALAAIMEVREKMAADFALLNKEWGMTDSLISGGCTHGFKPARSCPNDNCDGKALHLAVDQLSATGSI